MSRAGDAIYRALLRAFPRRFREARADEMARLFAEQRQRVAGRPLAIARLWWLAARDAIGHGLRARLRSASVTAAGRHAQDRASVSSSGLRAVAQPLRDVRLAVRVLRRTPVPTLVAVIALGLGIGVNAAIVSVVHELLIDPLPYPHADRLVLPWQRRGDSQTGLRLTPRITSVDRWREAKTLDAVVVYSNTRVTLGDGGTATVVEAVRIEPALLDFTGTRVIAGRPFTAADVESETAARQVLIGETLWATRFGRDAAALGRTITLDDVPHTIVGVLPRSFRLPLNRPELVVPLVRPRPAKDGQAVFFPIGTLARLAAGVSVEAAEAELTALAKGTIDPSWTVALRTAAEHLGGPVRDALIVLLGAVACVLLIACANVAHLLLAKNVARQRELSVRAALGATRARIFGQLMTEYLVLAVTAGVFGAAVAWLSIEALVAWRPTDIQALAFVRAGGLTYAASFALAILTGLVVGALPAWAAANVAVWSGRADGVRVAGDARGRVVRRMLNVAEVALALMLLAGAGLLLRTYMQLASRDLGFDPSGTVAVEVELGRARFPDAASRRAFVEPLAAAARQLPDVTHVALSVIVPPRGGLFFTVLETEGSAAPAEQTGFDGGIVSAGFFDTLRVPIVEGRGFVEADARESQRVIVVSKRTAAMLWPNGSAVGRRLRLDPSDPWSTVIGVAADVTSQSSSRDRPQIYVPLTPHQYDEAPTLIVRTAGDVDAVIAALRGQVAAIDPRVAISSIRTLDADVRGMNVRPRFNALLLGLLAAIGLVLAVTGIYGVINYSVGLRTRELGVRVALGASPAALGRSVIREAALVGTAGVAVGLGLWLIVGKGLASLLVGLGSTDVSTLAAVSAILLAATVLAAWLPARRAVRIDPVDALRAEG